jgi:hypothetical protein
MILRKSYFPLIGLFLLFSIDSCGQKGNHDSKEEILSFIEKAQTKSLEIFDGWDIWERSDGIVFNYKDKVHVLLIINYEEKGYMFKEIFPKQDSTFFPLNEIDDRSGNYPFKVADFPDKIFLFKELKVSHVESISELNLMMFINENFSVVFSQKGTNIKELNRYKAFTEYDNYWYYYLKEEN